MGKPKVLFTGEASFLSTGFARFNNEIIRRLYKTGKYEIAEMGSYASDKDERIGSIPWKFYGVLPLNEHEKKVYDSNPLNAFGEYKIEGVLSDFKPDIVCVPPGESVLTESGSRNIENIEVGERVLTHKGRFRKVLSTMKRQHSGSLVKIYTNGLPEPLSVTDEHPVLVYRKQKQTNQKKSFAKIYNGIMPEFIPAKDVQCGDFVVLSKHIDGEFITDIKISDYLKQFVLDKDKIRPNTKGKWINNNIKIDWNFGTLLGYIIGDGHISDSGVNITFNITEKDFALEAQKCFEEVFSVDSSMSIDENKNVCTVVCNSSIVSSFLKAINCKIRLPKLIIKGMECAKIGLLRGLIRSDGCYKKNTVSFLTTIRNIAYDYRAICASLGIPTNISKIAKEEYRDAYEINGYGQSAFVLATFADKKDMSKYDIYEKKNIKSCRTTQIINNHLVSSVRRKRFVDYEGQVYNLQVEEDNSYHVLNYCVHNCDMRDPWMMQHLQSNRFRSNYRLFLCPTVDSAPQKQEWIKKIFANADVLTTYSRYGKRVLEGAGLNVRAVTSPGINLNDFRPLDKEQLRDKYHLKSSLFIIGTVMRNQKRKLFPDLFHAYSKLRSKWTNKQKIARIKERARNGKKLTKDEKNALKIDHSVLYCHTSWPDVGWNLPDYLHRYNLQRHVIFTYKCEVCSEVFASWFIPTDPKGVAICRLCGNRAAHMPTTHHGVEEKDLIEIFNLFDLYVQPSICEGWGLPIVESKACGIPGLYQNYSAMEDHVENGGGLPIKVSRFYHEAETGAVRSLPDIDDLVIKMEKLTLNDAKRKKLANEARRCVEQKHDWDITANKFEEIFDELELLNRSETWDRPAKIEFVTPERPPEDLNDDEFVVWCYVNILGRAPDEKGFNDWKASLSNGKSRDEIEMYFRQLIEANNQLELQRCGMQGNEVVFEEENNEMPGVLL